MKKAMMTFMTASALAGLAFADVTFSDVVFRQRIPWGTQIDVWFVMKGADVPQYVIPTVRVDGADVELPQDAVFRDRVMQENGMGHLAINIERTTLGDRDLDGVTVSLSSATEMPLYRIYDLSFDKRSKDGCCPYVDVFESELHAGTYGCVATNPIAGIQSVAWTAITNGALYKSSKMVFRRILPGTVHDDHGDRDISVDKPYWAMVFDVTEAQFAYITNATALTESRMPAKGISYDALRGSWQKGVHYPDTGSRLGENALIWSFRTALGNATVDLPTRAQWEFMARAGATTPYFDNVTTTTHWGGKDDVDVDQEPKLLLLFNALPHDKQYYQGITKEVASYPPNAWGLYDVEGNMWKWVLDNDGSTSRHYRVGGMGQVKETRCRLGYAEDYDNADAGSGNGLRLVMPAE